MAQTKRELFFLLFSSLLAPCSLWQGLRGVQMGSRALGSRDPRGLRRGLGVEVGSPGGRAGRPARRRRRQEVFAQQAGEREHAGLPPSLTSFSGRFSACGGTQAPSPGPPVAVKHTLRAFPRAVPSTRACVIPHPQAYTLAGEGVCGRRGGAQAGGTQSVLYQPGSDPDRCFVLF